MCGITGWVDFQEAISHQTDLLQAMNEKLRDRGPDAEGTWVSKHVALGHRRFILKDPENGDQPMIKEIGGKRYVMTYDGEIYNHRELRSKLISLGYQMNTHSDTEVILTAFAEWKEDCLSYLNGVFAFAIWDETEQTLFLARDRIGVKPLFYVRKERSFLFASEIKSLLSHPLVSSIVNEEGLAELLVLGPARTPGCGVFRDISELKPGMWMRVDRDGVATQPYWKLVSSEHQDSFEDTVVNVRELFYQAVKRQLVSDVPIGTMLSGGLDSSAISACASRMVQEENRGKLSTYSVDYEGNDRFFQSNEFQPNADAPWVQQMVNYLQSDHRVVTLSIPDLIDHLPEACWARDLPGMMDIDTSLLLFCREIRKETKVVLSGECADELFGGYPWFHREELINSRIFPWARLTDQRIPFLTDGIKRKIKPMDYVETRYREALAEVPRLPDESGREARIRELFYLNWTRWMPTLLDRNDRMSMAAGLDVRTPFCDYHLVEYVWNIPWRMKAYGDREKGLLRKALEGILPEEIRMRKKSPYPKTHHPLYLNQMIKQVKQMIAHPSAPIFEWIDRKTLAQFLEQDLTKVHLPWFGQLMNVPQLLAYYYQLNQWIDKYRVTFK